MTEPEVELVSQKARETYPEPAPRLISDNGPQFIARDFKHFVRLSGMDHVRTSPYYPQFEREDRALAWLAESRGGAAEEATEPHGRAAGRRRVRGGVQHPGGCTAQSGTSRRTIAWPADTPRSGRHATAHSRPPVSVAPSGGTRRATSQRPIQFGHDRNSSSTLNQDSPKRSGDMVWSKTSRRLRIHSCRAIVHLFATFSNFQTHRK